MKKREIPDQGSGVRGLFVYRNGKWVRFKKRKTVQVHSVIPDEIEPMRSFASPTGEIFTSRSAYLKHLRALGYRDTGGEHLKEKPREKTQEEIEGEYREDIEQSYYDVKYDRIQFTEKERQAHLEEERKWKDKVKIKAPI